MDIISEPSNSYSDVFTDMGKHPAKAKLLQSLQMRLCDELNKIIAEAASSLYKEHTSRPPSPDISPSLDIAFISSNARQRARLAAQWKEFAECLVIQRLRNLQLLQSNAITGASNDSQEKSMLQALLEWEPA